MQYYIFINPVREQTKLASQDQAHSQTRATLETLGERAYCSARADLAAQLPDEL
jgi:uncharacterized protein (DUF2267 family)